MEQARNYSNQGKLDEAVSAYKKALEMTTRDWERQNAERQLMRLYRRQGTLEEVLKEAEQNDTLTFTMQAELARHYRNRGESEKRLVLTNRHSIWAPKIMSETVSLLN